MNVLSVSMTEAGRGLARRLPWPTVHGSLGDTVRQRWGSVDALVLFVATGAAVRVIGPLLGDKASDPAVVCIDEGGHWAVALCGGHAGGANDLAREIAALIGAQAVVTTASDAIGLPALDALPGLRAEGDVAAVTRALLDHQAVEVHNPRGWPLPPGLAERLRAASAPVPPNEWGGPAGVDLPDGDGGDTPGRRPLPAVVVSDEVHQAPDGVVTLHPPSLVVGVGAASGAPAAEMAGLAKAALTGAGLSPSSVSAVATLDRKRTEPAVRALAAAFGAPLHGLPAATLAAVDVPNPSPVVEAAVGTPSVAEAAALAAAGPDATLVVPKCRSATATVAVARRTLPPGHLWVVGLGPGDAAHRTPAATAAVRGAEIVIGYGPYIEQAADALSVGAEVVRSPIGDEVGRATRALAEAAAGRRVALVCSGDAGVYAMASIVYELTPLHPGLEPASDVGVVPGVTAALAAAAALGAPLGHDHVAISLSDLLTPWEVIEARLRAAAEADLVVSVYNPRSAGRRWQLAVARDIIASRRPATTPVGMVTDAGRPDERVVLTTLAELDPALAGMTTCVVIGASSTKVVRGRMVTPRGYRS